jgi:DNA-directed RNA polymerase beta' subunit
MVILSKKGSYESDKDREKRLKKEGEVNELKQKYYSILKLKKDFASLIPKRTRIIKDKKEELESTKKIILSKIESNKTQINYFEDNKICQEVGCNKIRVKEQEQIEKLNIVNNEYLADIEKLGTLFSYEISDLDDKNRI